MKIMFICTGNICRSAMADWLLKKKLEELEIKNIEVYSSGTNAFTGDRPTEEAIEVMKEYEVDLRKHKATNMIESKIKEPLIDIFKSCKLIFHQDRVSLCSPGWSRTHYVDQTSLKLIKICLSLPPKC